MWYDMKSKSNIIVCVREREWEGGRGGGGKEKENDSRLPISKLLPKDKLAQQGKHLFVSFPKISMKYIFIVKLLLLYKYFFLLD